MSAFSNKNIINSELAEFLKLVESGEIGEGHCMVIYSLDRLSRRSSWDEDTIQKVVKSGVVIHDVSTPIVLSKEDQFSKIIMELIISRGNNESKIKSERSTAGWEKRLRDAKEHGKVFTKKLPRWLSTNEAGYILIPEQVELIKRIFTEYINGLTSPMIARRLNEEGIKSTGNSLWRPNTITKLIKDERLRGNLRRNNDGSLIPNIFPVVIDDEIFESANRILAVNAAGTKGRPRENNANREVQNILTGLIRCGKCGSKVTTSKNSRGVRYVVCRNRLNFRLCGQSIKKLELLEKWLIIHIKQIDLQKILSFKKKDISQDELITNEILALESEANSFITEIEARRRENKTPSFRLENSLTEIEDRILELKKQLKEVEIDEPLVEIDLIDVEKLMDFSNIELRMSLRKYLIQIIEKITFQSIRGYNFVEVVYKKDIYKHILIMDMKMDSVIHEVAIEFKDKMINYTTKSFSIYENTEEGTCTISGIYNANVKDYALLANYMALLEGKHWIVEWMFAKENFSIVSSN